MREASGRQMSFACARVLPSNVLFGSGRWFLLAVMRGMSQCVLGAAAFLRRDAVLESEEMLNPLDDVH
jgi:hypothetical protein